MRTELDVFLRRRISKNSKDNITYELPSDMCIKNNGLTAGKDQYLKCLVVLSDINFNKNGGYIKACEW